MRSILLFGRQNSVRYRFLYEVFIMFPVEFREATPIFTMRPIAYARQGLDSVDYCLPVRCRLFSLRYFPWMLLAHLQATPQGLSDLFRVHSRVIGGKCQFRNYLIL